MADRESLGPTQTQADTGLAASQDVYQATALLNLVRAQATDPGIEGALLEHGIAVLLGQTASLFRLARTAGELEDPRRRDRAAKDIRKGVTGFSGPAEARYKSGLRTYVDVSRQDDLTRQ
jgi:outer membrane protein TolC